MKARPFAPPRGRMPTIEWLPIAELLIDDIYQRAVETNASEKLIAGIARDWDWDLVDVLKVSRRPDDRLFVVDGQHRRAAAARRPDIPQLPCVVKRCADAAEEARLFIAANRGRKPMSRFDDHRAAVGAGDEVALSIERMASSAGLSISRHGGLRGLKPGELLILSPIKRALALHGEETTATALRLIGEAFPDEVIASPAALFGAIVALLVGGADYDRLFEALLAGTTQEWEAWAGIVGIRTGGRARLDMMRTAIDERYRALAVAA